MVDEFLIKHLADIKDICVKNNVERLYVFGSIVDGRFIKGKSDIDMLVEFNEELYSKKENAKSILKLWIQLQSILDTKVDLITNDNIEEAYFKKYLTLYKEIIYDRQIEAQHLNES